MKPHPCTNESNKVPKSFTGWQYSLEPANNYQIAMHQSTYENLIANSFYYAPTYLLIYGFMKATRSWPLL